MVSTRIRPLSIAVAAGALATAGCIPYTVGTTAQPAPVGEATPSLIVYATPSGLEISGDTTDLPFIGVDAEARIGINDHADLGLRVVGVSGLVATYKHRLTRAEMPTDPAVALMGGFGLVNFGKHAYVELNLLASAKRTAVFTPYGGLRLTQVIPLASGAVSDSPTAGGFVGVRIGNDEIRIGPELGVFYDRSALGLRSSNIVFVPAIVVDGKQLIEQLLSVLQR